MQTFPIEVNGQIIPIEAPDLETAMQVMTEMGLVKAPVTAGGLAKQGVASLGKGVAYAAGLPGTIRDLMERGLNKGMQKGYELFTGEAPETPSAAKAAGHEAPGGVETFFAGPDPEVMKKLNMQMPGEPGIGSGGQLAGLLGELTGGYTERQPQNVPEEYVRSIGEFAPTGAMLGGIPGLLFGGVAPAVGSETAGQLARNYLPNERPQWMPDWVPDKETSARIAGAVMTPSLISKGQSLITPNPASKTARIKAAKNFDKENIPYSAAQKTGSRSQAYRETEAGGAAYASFKDAQELAFTRQALKRIGSNADEADEVVMAEASDRVGNMFTQLASRNSIPHNVQMVRDLRGAVRTYFDKVAKPNRSPIVENTIREISNVLAKGGQITGQQYQSMITRLREAGQGATADLQIATRGIRNALDDAMERSIARNNPSDLGAWRVARNNYRDLIAIEETLATGAGGAEGIINPTKLHQVLVNQRGARHAVQTKTDLTELARDGKVLMRQIAPDSGTASRLAKRLGGAAAYGGGTGAAIGHMIAPGLGDFIGAGAGMVAGPVMSAIKSKVIMDPRVQKYLGNQVLKRPPPIMNPRGGNLPPRGVPPRSGATAPPDEDLGGILRIVGQEEAARRTGKPRYAGGRNVD